ncbi:MAG TPA: sensor histidine kinase [Solirubrobacterales bacterium]|nr:sensor histidine kinase [Solirubrobacterales bacterium]
MSSFRRALIGLGTLAFLTGIGMLILILTSAHTHVGGTFAPRGTYAAYTLALGWGFAGTGLYAWARRPENNVGPLMIALGFAWLLQGMAASSDSVVFSIGTVSRPLAYALLVHLLLAFPSGRLETRAQRWLTALVYFDVTVLQLASFVFEDTTASYANCDACPANPILISDSHTLYDLTTGLQGACALIALVGLVAVLYRRWRRNAPGQRRVLAPILSVGGLALLFVVVATVADSSGANPVSDGAFVVALTVVGLIPFAFLVGLLRSRLGRAEAATAVVGRLGEAAGRTGLREALADALGDPELEVAYWVPGVESYVDADGDPVALPGPGSGRFATEVEHDGRRLAAIIHDASLEDARDLVRTVGAAAAMTLENERLDAELRVKVAELRASRSRIVDAGYEQRRRLERDLHDGAQQRLMALGINLRLVRERIEGDPQEAAELLDASMTELNEATAELRELGRGIHPAVLTDRGLEAALKGLAGRSPVPVELVETPYDRLPSSVESAVYFVVAEALTNVARYAEAGTAKVSVVRDNGQVEVQVSDDGVGGADPEQGSGLSGLTDRVAALDGSLDLTSVAGQGTTVTARIPCG